MTVVELAEGGELPEGFLELPRQIYGDDPAWIPEDAASVAAQFRAANPWFEKGRAMVACRPGQGRVAAFRVPGQCIDDEDVAYFGFFECVNDPSVARALLDEVETWARSQGATRVYGPINFSTFGAYRFRLEGFAEGVFPGEPYNPPYYPELLRASGFAQPEALRYLSFPIDIPVLLASSRSEYDAIRPVVESRLRIERLTAETWMANLDAFYLLVDEVFGQNFGYAPISREHFRQLMGQPFADKLCPYSSTVAWAPDGRIAGFFLTQPDYSPLMNQQAGAARQSSVSFERDFPRLPQPRTVLLRTVGVHPEFRRMGLSIYLGLEGCRLAQEQYGRVIATLLKTDNPSTRFPRRHTNAPRSYGLFTKSLEA